MSFKVALDIYEGPLDLLYYLIQKQRLSITEISLVRITHQFLEMIELMREIDLDVAADFLRIAALLIELKARELLPPTAYDDAEELDEVKLLLNQLEELQKFKSLATYFQDKEQEQSRVWFRENDPSAYEEIVEFQPTLFDLLKALKQVLLRVDAIQEQAVIEPVRFTVVDRMNEIIDYLHQKHISAFHKLFDRDETRTMIIITFLALLELIKLRLVLTYQREAFGEIIIHKNFQGKPPRLSGDAHDFTVIERVAGESVH